METHGVETVYSSAEPVLALNGRFSLASPSEGVAAINNANLPVSKQMSSTVPALSGADGVFGDY